MRILSIEKATNGFVIEACVPLKPKNDKDSSCCYSPSSYKSILVKDISELNSEIEKLIPLLDTEYSDDGDFDKAYKEATKGV